MTSTEQTGATATDAGKDGEGDLPSLIIPIKSASNGSSDEQFIEIFPEEMESTSASTLLKVLRDEQADLNVWADASLLYMHKKHARDSLTLLEEACELPTTNKNERVRILAATGIAHLAATQQENPTAAASATGGAGGSAGNRQRTTTGVGDTDDPRQLADDKFTQAGKMDTFYPMTWIGKGMLNLGKNRVEQAKFFFQTTLKQCGPVMPALLGMAAVLFGEGDFKGAQSKYGEAIRRYPAKSGASTRVGFGLSCYKLGQVDRAKAAFARALDMDPECVEAMVGAAILDMAGLDETAKDFSSRTEKAIKMMSMANLLDHSNAMVQNHLANHYFWKWTPLTGTVDVTQGSTLVKGSQPIPLDPGESIRIGTRFETTVKEDATLDDDDEEGTKIRVAASWKDPSAKGLKVWKKDYERVFALAKGAYSSTVVQEIQAESLFLLARVYHVREDNENAHMFYERACKFAPDLSPARFGLAQSLVVKEEYDEATKQLKQLLATSSGNATDALALLGLLEVRSGGQNLEEGLAHLRKAIEQDPLNPELVVLEALALQQHKSNYVKALDRYKKAVDLMNRKSTPVPYEIYTNIGVLCHETKKVDEALEAFVKALHSLDDDSSRRQASLDNVGFEGGTVRHDDNSMFFGYVDTVLKARPQEENKKIVRISGSKELDVEGLPVKISDHVRIGDGFTTEVVSINSTEGVIELELQSEYEPLDATKGDEENQEPKRQNDDEVPIFVKRENKLLDSQEATTVAFNIARLHEAAGRTLAAIELHKAIIKRNPVYVNSYLRLGCIAVDCGSLKECSEWLKLAAAAAPGNSEVLTLIGNLHLSLCDWKPAQSVFDGLMMNKVPSVQAYASLSMGTIFFETLHVNEQRYSKHLQYASDYYKSILSKDPLNAYAANGIGTILGEKGEIFKAKEVFNRVREVSGDTIADALLNLGHIYLAQKKHPEAIQMYESYMKRAEDGTTPITSKSRLDDVVNVLQYIAFAFFDWARHTELFNDANAAPADGRYKEAMKHLEKALSKNSKKEVVLKYNLCMTKLQAANCVLQKLTRNIPRTVEEVEDALNGLQESLMVVEAILKDKEEGNKKIAIRTSMLEDFLKHCRANIDSAKSHLEDEKKRAEEERQEREIRRLAAEAAFKEEALKKAIKKEEESKQQEERDEKAAARLRQVEGLGAYWREQQQQQAARDAAKGTKGKRKPTDDGFIVNDTLEEENLRPPELFESDGDEDDERQQTRNEKVPEPQEAEPVVKDTELFGDSDGESDEELVANDDGKDGEQPTKKRRVLEEGEDE